MKAFCFMGGASQEKPMRFKTKLLIALTVLCIVDIVFPVPILGLTLIYAVVAKSPWLPDMVSRIYRPEPEKE